MSTSTSEIITNDIRQKLNGFHYKALAYLCFIVKEEERT